MQLFATGLGSLIDLETARRNQLSAQLAVKDIEQEQVSAWIALYRAAGGSWEEAQQSAAEAKPQDSSPANTIDPALTKPQQSISGEKS
jgi:outer membrane protein TolC